ncbi:cardiolipin synthase [Paenibacillus sp. P26]|nr:cardiolipin synthase [Paenibacillus sp. P26]UUZ90582.1 cardiolipin synthase [Paenibacillus sp. P25]
MEFYSNVHTAFFLINMLLVMFIIFLDRREAAVTWSWLIVLLFLPVLGFFLYLLFGQNVSGGRWYKNHPDVSHRIPELVKDQTRRIEQEQFVYKDPSVFRYQDLIYMNLTANGSPLTQDNRVEIFTDGQDKFKKLLECIEEAKDHIHLLYYKVRNDTLGHQILKALTAKAKEGVKVRFLYDDIGCYGLSGVFFKELKEAGGEVVSFFSSAVPFLNLRMNYRNHRKIAVIDGKIGFIGGFNIGKEYIGLDPKIGHWRDTHLKLTGGAVHMLQAIFLTDWNQSRKHRTSFEPRYYPVPELQGKPWYRSSPAGRMPSWIILKTLLSR